MTDFAYPANTKYTDDLTSYINSISGVDYTPGEGLLLTPPASANTTTFNRLIMGDYSGPQNGQLRLQLYYLTIQ